MAWSVRIMTGVLYLRAMFTASMAVSGFTANEFLFLGFLARTTNVRKEILERHKTYSKPIVIFEAPHRIQSLLAVILETFGNRELAICRELTKLHEEIFRGTVKEASEFFENPPVSITFSICSLVQHVPTR